MPYKLRLGTYDERPWYTGGIATVRRRMITNSQMLDVFTHAFGRERLKYIRSGSHRNRCVALSKFVDMSYVHVNLLTQ